MDLKQLNALVSTYEASLDLVITTKACLKQHQTKCDALAKLVMDAMAEAGQANFSTATRKFCTAKVRSVTIPKEHQAEVAYWLKAHGMGDCIGVQSARFKSAVIEEIKRWDEEHTARDVAGVPKTVWFEPIKDKIKIGEFIQLRATAK